MDRAIRNLGLAAKQGNAEAYFCLGKLHEEVSGIWASTSQMVVNYRKAAELGSVEAQFYIGYCLYAGKWGRKDLKEAAKYFEMAAK